MTAGNIYTVAGDGTAGFTGDGGPAVVAGLASPNAVALDRHGNLLITDSTDNRIRVVPNKTGTYYGQKMTVGDIYTVAGDGSDSSSGDSGPATGAGLPDPLAVVVDRAGNLVIDSDFEGSRIRVVAAATGTFYGQQMTAGDIYTVAGTGSQGFSGDGGPATSAELNNPGDVTLDSAGNLVIADTLNARVRVVAAATRTFYGQQMTAGNIYTVAGDGTYGFSGDGGPAASASFHLPVAAAPDGAGNVVIADSDNNRIRVVAAAAGRSTRTADDRGRRLHRGRERRRPRLLRRRPRSVPSAQLSKPYGVAVDHSRRRGDRRS